MTKQSLTVDCFTLRVRNDACTTNMKLIDNFLNGITMYKVVLYGLLTLAGVSLIFSFAGIIYYKPLNLLGSLLLITTVCFFSNILFGKMLKAPINVESSLITGLILFFIFDPLSKPDQVWTLVIASLIAMASKYVLAYKRKHIFNPAAISAVILGMLGTIGSLEMIGDDAIWWIGADVLLPVVAIIGFLIVRKIRRFRMVLTFIGTALVSTALVGVFMNNVPAIDAMTQALLSFPLIFFATVMLTEPWTSPHRNTQRIIYAVIIGLLFSAQFEFGPIFSTPELALVIGNIYAFVVSPKQRLFLSLKEKRKLAEGMYEFIFKPDQKLAFLPGQYLEWTVPIHGKVDSRGNRRYFTIASSPGDPDIRLGVRIQEKGSSSFKQILQNMKPGDTMDASQLTGDFTLDAAPDRKLVFIAGGIGVTPFRSMVQDMLDKQQKRDVIFLYTVPHPNELAYRDIFERAGRDLGMKYYYVVTRPENAPADWTGKKGRIDESMIKEIAPDFKERQFYLSGPNAMVVTYRQLLYKLGVPWKNIHTDFFPGF